MQDLCINYRSHVFEKLHIRTNEFDYRFRSGSLRKARNSTCYLFRVRMLAAVPDHNSSR
jgi:hypothetical protein